MLQLNQFNQIPVQGQLDLHFNPQTISCEVDSSELGSLVPGQAVKMVDSDGGVPKVVAAALNSDDIFGFINYNLKDKTYVAGEAVELSFFKGNVMQMTASAAIARNAKVAVVIADKEVVTASGGMTIVGRALDKATAADQLIRVIIDLPGATA